MARAPNPKVSKAHELYKSGMRLVDIAKELDVPVGTIRSWKNRYQWDDEKPNATLQNKRNVAKEVEIVAEATELNDKQRMFCLYYVKYFNATKAYKKAYGCNELTARANGSRLLAKEPISNEIMNLKQEKMNQVFLRPEDIFQKYIDIAFSDLSDFVEFGKKEQIVGFSEEGKLITADDNFVDLRNHADVDGSLIREIKVGKQGTSIKLQDQMKALQWLTDHMDMATEEQKARIAMLKARVNTEDDEPTEYDGFIDALAGKVEDIWQEE